MLNFDAIFVDFYGTVVGGDRQAVAAVCARVVADLELNTTPKAFALTWGEHFFSLIESCNGEGFATLRDIEFRSLSTALGHAAHGVDLATYVEDMDAYWANPPIHDDALAFLQAVRLPVCCVSNADERPLHDAIHTLGLAFSEVISSESVRCYKPNPTIFEVALDRMACKPDRVLHIGDSRHSDVAGAAALGMTTAWVCRADRIHDIGTATPDFTVPTLTSLMNGTLAEGSSCVR